MISNKSKQLSITAFVAVLLTLMLFTPALADKAHSDAGNKLKIKKQTLKNITLTRFIENQALINGSPYIFTSNTKFTRKNKYGRTILIKINEINKIVLPCPVDITYRTYSVYTESSPFYPGDRVLTSLSIKKQ